MYGISFLKRLNGMFAIGAWNNLKKRLFYLEIDMV